MLGDSKLEFKTCGGQGHDNGSNMNGKSKVFKRAYVRIIHGHFLWLVGAIL
jgi:hypothetical protein